MATDDGVGDITAVRKKENNTDCVYMCNNN